MSVLAHPSRRYAAPSADALATALVALGGLVAVAAAAERALSLNDHYSLAAAGVFAMGAAAVLVLAARQLPGRFGAANRVTLARFALTALVLALLGERGGPTVEWFAVTVALAALVLDGVDGRLARRGGTASRFGARFDMETDALLILALSALAWHFGKAGAWVLLAGLMRYVFVAAGRIVPALAGALPPSKRRQTVCVVQIAALIACVSPLLTPPGSEAVALAALLVLSGSFAADVGWLLRRRDAGPRAEPPS